MTTVVSTSGATTTTDRPETTVGSVPQNPTCGDAEPFDNFENESPGPFFVCSVTSGPLLKGGRVFGRPNVSDAEAAILEWAHGPNPSERELGYDGWDLAQYDWFVDSLTLERDASILYMDLEDWRPVNNLSTSYGTTLFITTLLGTAFSDPSVDTFVLTILGETCPQIGEGEYCFPITREAFLQGAF